MRLATTQTLVVTIFFVIANVLNGSGQGTTTPEETQPAISSVSLIDATKSGSIEQVKAAIAAGANVDARDSDRCTALCWASRKGYAEIVRLLLSNGASVNGAGSCISTPLQGALSQDHKDIRDILIAKGANVDSESLVSGIGWTPLMLESMSGNIEIVRYLLSKGADVNHRSSIGPVGVGMTALMCACASEKGNAVVVSSLLDKGAEVNARSDVRTFGGLEVENAGEIVTTGGDTALIMACKGGDVDVVRMLLTNGAEIDQKNGRGESALSVAKTDSIRLLLREAGARE